MTGKEKQQFYRHVRALSSLLQPGKYGAESAAETILVLWSTAQCPCLKCDGLAFSEKFAALAKVQCFVAWLGQLELLDSAYWLSSAYAIWTGDEYRRNLAMFFTPPSITKRLLDDLEQAGVSFTEHSFFDPACGGAACSNTAGRLTTDAMPRPETSTKDCSPFGFVLPEKLTPAPRRMSLDQRSGNTVADLARLASATEWNVRRSSRFHTQEPIRTR